MHHLRALLPVAWYSLWFANHNDDNDITLTSIFPFFSSRSFHACFRAGVSERTLNCLTNKFIEVIGASGSNDNSDNFCVYDFNRYVTILHLFMVNKKDGILRRKCTARNTGRFISGPCLPIIFDPARRAGDLTSGVTRIWDWVRNVVFTCLHRSALNSIFDTLPSM